MQATKVIDCHAHIIDPARFPYDDGPGYKPRPHELGTQEAYVAALDKSQVSYALLVQPSCYGFDNSALLDAMDRNPGRFKSIVVLDPKVTDKELGLLAEAGVVGVRFNLVSFDGEVFRRAETVKLLERIRALDWFAEVVADDVQWQHAAGVLKRSNVRVLVDHFGMNTVLADVERPGFRAVLELGRRGNSVVKLSTPFSLGLPRERHHVVDPFVTALIDAFGIERCVWGSDWPFLTITDPPDLAEAIDCVRRWVPDQRDQERVLWRNPIRLFGFGTSRYA